MTNLRFDKMSGDAQSLAERLGTHTTEMLIRAASGVQQGASVSAQAAREGVAATEQQVGNVVHGLAEGVHDVALPTTSARMAWRAGRMLGRIEGAIRLAAFGVRFWRRTRRRRRESGQAQGWVRPLLQWGPSAFASAYLVAQMWGRVRRRAVSA